MSISSSLSNAVSGLAAASKSAEVISSNVANANTEGYGKRTVSLAANGFGGGVRVVGLNRVVNDVAISDRRIADAALGSSVVNVSFFSRMESVIGLPGDPDSLSIAVSSFEASLISGAGSPDNVAFLSQAVNDASKITQKINLIADEIQNTRQNADAAISSQVSLINSALASVSDLNTEIRRQSSAGGEVAGLMDQRQRHIDQISEFIPLREIARDNGRIALMTQSGATLVDDRAATLEFQPTPIITADMTLASGALSGLTIQGASSSLGSAIEAIAGGALAANFEMRDATAVSAQQQIDAIARNLSERFSGPTVDPTLAPGESGLFTDAGATFDPLNEEGIANRISISAIVDPNQGGTVSKLRDGVNSVTSGPVGENALLVSLKSALVAPVLPASGTFQSSGQFSDISNNFLSEISVSRQNSEQNQAFNVSRVTALKDIELNDGVSTDDELQRLLLVEQAYAANARVIQSVDEMLQSLLRI